MAGIVCHRAVVFDRISKSKTGTDIQSEGRPIDSRVRTRSPATLAGLAVYLAAAPRRRSLAACGVPPRRAQIGVGQKSKMPDGVPSGILLWRRPTLARPVAVLPSGLQRFTSVFGMGTGGATALLSPEFCAGFSAQNSSE
jgi:hypothetical protein